jgi:phosphoglycolate phosphatase
MRFRAVLFDFDLTLADSTKAVVACFTYSLETLGLPKPTPEDVRGTIGLGLGEALTLLTGVQDQATERQFRKLFVEHADRIMVDQTELLEGVLPALDDLRGRGVLLGIVSTKYRYRIEHTLDRFGIRDRFSTLVGGDSVDALKPDPAGLLLSLTELGMERGQALYVGDHVVDAEAANRASVPFVGVLTGTKTEKDFEAFPKVAILPGVADLPAFLAASGHMEATL